MGDDLLGPRVRVTQARCPIVVFACLLYAVLLRHSENWEIVQRLTSKARLTRKPADLWARYACNVALGTSYSVFMILDPEGILKSNWWLAIIIIKLGIKAFNV